MQRGDPASFFRNEMRSSIYRLTRTRFAIDGKVQTDRTPAMTRSVGASYTATPTVGQGAYLVAEAKLENLEELRTQRSSMQGRTRSSWTSMGTFCVLLAGPIRLPDAVARVRGGARRQTPIAIVLTGIAARRHVAAENPRNAARSISRAFCRAG